MKPLSLEEIDELKTDSADSDWYERPNDKQQIDRLLYTARKYHWLRKALLAASERSSYYWERQGAHTSHDFKNEGAIALATELLKEIYE